MIHREDCVLLIERAICWHASPSSVIVFRHVLRYYLPYRRRCAARRPSWEKKAPSTRSGEADSAPLHVLDRSRTAQQGLEAHQDLVLRWGLPEVFKTSQLKGWMEICVAHSTIAGVTYVTPGRIQNNCSGRLGGGTTKLFLYTNGFDFPDGQRVCFPGHMDRAHDSRMAELIPLEQRPVLNTSTKEIDLRTAAFARHARHFCRRFSPQLAGRRGIQSGNGCNLVYTVRK